MGQPKQLLPYRGQTLLGYVLQCALASSCSRVIVVLGANADKIEPEIEQFPIEIVKNSEWARGISSSIRCGASYIQEKFPNTNGIIFLACDQPFISADAIEQLIKLYSKSGKPIIASQYKTTRGIPALFGRSFYSDLTQLQGDQGAKQIIQKQLDQVATVNFPKGEIDLDTPTQYQQLISEKD